MNTISGFSGTSSLYFGTRKSKKGKEKDPQPRPLSFHSAIVAKSEIGLNLSADEIVKTVNHVRTEKGQEELRSSLAGNSNWIRSSLPTDSNPYDANDVRVFRNTESQKKATQSPNLGKVFAEAFRRKEKGEKRAAAWHKERKAQEEKQNNELREIFNEKPLEFWQDHLDNIQMEIGNLEQAIQQKKKNNENYYPTLTEKVKLEGEKNKLKALIREKQVELSKLSRKRSSDSGLEHLDMLEI